jgi:hypothetical protein
VEVNKLKRIKLSLMEAIGDIDKKNKTEYLIRTSATINVDNTVEKAIVEYGIEDVLTVIYNDLLKENNVNVDSIGMWVEYDGKEYENSIQLQTLNDMERLGEDDVNAIYEFFKLMSPVKELKIK